MHVAFVPLPNIHHGGSPLDDVSPDKSGSKAKQEAPPAAHQTEAAFADEEYASSPARSRNGSPHLAVSRALTGVQVADCSGR